MMWQSLSGARCKSISFFSRKTKKYNFSCLRSNNNNNNHSLSPPLGLNNNRSTISPLYKTFIYPSIAANTTTSSLSSFIRTESTYKSKEEKGGINNEINNPINDKINNETNNKTTKNAFIPFVPPEELQEVNLAERLRLVSWLASHNAIPLSFFSARVKNNKTPLPASAARPIDYAYTELFINLSNSNAVRLKQVFSEATDARTLRKGRLLEVIDCFAGDVAFNYCFPFVVLNNNKEELFVTVAVDAVRLYYNNNNNNNNNNNYNYNNYNYFISADKDLTLKGFVSHAGTSSVEITTQIFQEGDLIASAFLVFVLVGADGKPKRKIPPLIKENVNSAVYRQLQEAEKRQKLRKEKQAKSIIYPNESEFDFLHSIWKKTKTINKINSNSSNVFNYNYNIRWIKDTRLETNILMQPETISLYGRAFGGYIMRSALELSFMNAQRFLQIKTPVLIGMEDIRFFDAVLEGDILLLSSHVVWTDKKEIQIKVEASSGPVGSPLKRTNAFIFYYKQDKEIKTQEEELHVYPQSYGEYMWLLAARRRAMKRNKIN